MVNCGNSRRIMTRQRESQSNYHLKQSLKRSLKQCATMYNLFVTFESNAFKPNAIESFYCFSD